MASDASQTQLDALFNALADPTRRAILAQLATGEATVSELAEPYGLAQPTISKHLKVLETAGLISTGRDATRRPRRIEANALALAESWFEPFRTLWNARYQALDGLLEEMDATQTTPPPPEKRVTKRRRKP